MQLDALDKRTSFYHEFQLDDSHMLIIDLSSVRVARDIQKTNMIQLHVLFCLLLFVYYTKTVIFLSNIYEQVVVVGVIIRFA